MYWIVRLTYQQSHYRCSEVNHVVQGLYMGDPEHKSTGKQFCQNVNISVLLTWMLLGISLLLQVICSSLSLDMHILWHLVDSNYNDRRRDAQSLACKLRGWRRTMNLVAPDNDTALHFGPFASNALYCIWFLFSVTRGQFMLSNPHC